MSRADTIAHAKQLRDSGLPLRLIAERLGMSKTGLRDLLRDPDATVRPLAAPRMGVWTEARIALLTKLWNEGKSGGEIALRLACGISRNAVLGKADRLGLLQSRAEPSAPSLRAPPVKRGPANPVGRRPQAKPAKPKLSIAGCGAVFEQAPAASEPLKVKDDPPGLCTPLTLGAHMCKWPIGDPLEPGFTHCGKKASGSYCEAHLARAYVPAKPRTAAQRDADERRRLGFIAHLARRWAA